MKKFASIIILGILLSSSCKPVVLLKAPPGQVKKATGAKSAKSFAPGQQKKATGSKSAKPFAPGQKKKK